MRIFKKHLSVTMSVVLWGILVAGIFVIPLSPLPMYNKVETSILKEIESPFAIVFFGFQGCGDVCPVTLTKLAHLMNSLNEDYYIPQIVFVDIESVSNSESASKFAKMFHPSFQGVHVSNDNLAYLKDNFGLNIQEQLGQISHVGRTYVLEKIEGEWLLIRATQPYDINIDRFKKMLSKEV